MGERRLVRCTAPACAMRDLKVRTDAETCLSCGSELKPALDLGDLLGGPFFGGPKS